MDKFRLDIIALVISALTFILSVIINWNKGRIDRLKSRPIFYIRSTYENRMDRYIDIEIVSYKNDFLRKVDITWSGEKEVLLKYDKIPTSKENLWNYKIRLDVSKTDKTKDVKGKVILKCTTVYEKSIYYNKDINILSKYYPMVEEYSQEIAKISSTEFEEKIKSSSR